MGLSKKPHLGVASTVVPGSGQGSGRIGSMPQLQPPSIELKDTFLSAMAEFETERGTESATDSWIGRWSPRWSDAATFVDFIDDLRAQRLNETPRPVHFVPTSTWWWVEDGVYLGRVSLRHELNDRLLEWGGHLGYDVRPTARRKGLATAMVAAALPIAADLGIARLLVTCEVDNLASRAVIEANGGVFEDMRGTRLRFWVETGS